MGGEAEVSRGARRGSSDARCPVNGDTRTARPRGTPGCRVAGVAGCGGAGAGAGSEARKKEKVAGAGSEARKKEKDGRRKLRGEKPVYSVVFYMLPTKSMFAGGFLG